jgi:hypothetical protein
MNRFECGTHRWGARAVWSSLFLGLLSISASAATGPKAVISAYEKLPLAFEANRGQAPADTRFVARGPGYQVQLAADAVILSLGANAEQTAVVSMHFLGARSDARAHGEERLSSISNYFLGSSPSEQFADIPNYARVDFDDVYPGIGITYYGNQRQLEYDLVVAPGADASPAKLAVEGADDVAIDGEGNLKLRVGAQTMRMLRPTVYQEIDGKRTPISARFTLAGHNIVSIRTGAYDHSRALTVDPTLVYSSYLGGSNDDHARAIAVDGSGNVYLTGDTSSTDFPLLSAYQTSGGRTPRSAFVTKMNATGTALIYSTYLGDKSATNVGYGIAVDASGYAYVTGTTTGSAFPTTSGAYQTTSTSGNNAFVSKLGPSGNTLSYSTYVRNASTAAIALDGNGYVYVTGNAVAAFATTTGSYQPTSHSSSGTNAFVLKLNTSATPAVYSTFIGGSSSDYGYGVAVDASGNAYIGGIAGSSDFPLANAYESAVNGTDGFIAKLNPQGSGLVYSTRLGGSNGDGVFAIALDASGSVYATGLTGSFDFPVSANALQRSKGGPNYSGGFCIGCRINYTTLPNGFVTKLSPDGRSVVYSTYLGGNGSGQSSYGDYGAAIAVDSTGHAFVAGSIGSTTGFPLIGDLKTGQPDDTTGLFVAKLSALGDAELFGTHIGWTIDDDAVGTGASIGVAVDAKGDVYSTAAASGGGDLGGDSFLVSTGAYQTAPKSTTWRDAIVSKLTTGNQLTATLTPSLKSLDVGQSLTATISVAYVSGGSMPSGSVLVYDGASQIASATLANGSATVPLTLAVGVHRLMAVYRNNGAEGVSSISYVAVNQPATCN